MLYTLSWSIFFNTDFFLMARVPLTKSNAKLPCFYTFKMLPHKSIPFTCHLTVSTLSWLWSIRRPILISQALHGLSPMIPIASRTLYRCKLPSLTCPWNQSLLNDKTGTFMLSFLVPLPANVYKEMSLLSVGKLLKMFIQYLHEKIAIVK